MLGGAGFGLMRLARQPDIVSAEELYRFTRARQEAVKAQNQIAYSRQTVDNAGRLLAGAKRDEWKIVAETALAPFTGPALQVVFLHDQDLPFAESINRGNYLSRLIRQWTATKQADLPVEFHTFSWRADFGPDEFANARLAAHVQAASLASYLQTIGRPNAPLVVIAHGLGAQLVLDVLHQRRENRVNPPIKAVLLIQPAVHRINVGRGSYEVTSGEDVKSVRYDGTYFYDFAAAESVFATCSQADSALRESFPENAGAETLAPKRDIALGLPYLSATEAEILPDNFRLIDLSPGRHLDMAFNHHDGLYDASGRRAMWALWQNVLRKL